MHTHKGQKDKALSAFLKAGVTLTPNLTDCAKANETETALKFALSLSTDSLKSQCNINKLKPAIR